MIKDELILKYKMLASCDSNKMDKVTEDRMKFMANLFNMMYKEPITNYIKSEE